MLLCSQYTVVLSDISLFSPGEVRTRRTGEWTIFRENQQVLGAFFYLRGKRLQQVSAANENEEHTNVHTHTYQTHDTLTLKMQALTQTQHIIHTRTSACTSHWMDTKHQHLSNTSYCKPVQLLYNEQLQALTCAVLTLSYSWEKRRLKQFEPNAGTQASPQGLTLLVFKVKVFSMSHFLITFF